MRAKHLPTQSQNKNTWASTLISKEIQENYLLETKIVIKCPNCRKEMAKPSKEWKYGQFVVEAYVCNNCNAKFREYTENGKHSFTLKLQKGKGFRKA